jgi:hypothetical protein
MYLTQNSRAAPKKKKKKRKKEKEKEKDILLKKKAVP